MERSRPGAGIHAPRGVAPRRYRTCLAGAPRPLPVRLLAKPAAPLLRPRRTAKMVPENPPVDPLGDAIHAAHEIQRLLEAQRWSFCFIGGLALQRWGEPRVTLDVDLSLLTGFGQEESFIRFLLDHYEPRRNDAARFALQYRVVLLKNRAGVGIDIALAALPFEEDVIRRSSLADYLPGIRLRTCSAEDLIVMKAFAGRNRDWQDVTTIVQRQGNVLDVPYIVRQLSPLLDAKEDVQSLLTLKSIFRAEGLT